MLAGIARDVLYAVRLLKKDPAFTLVVVLTLAVAIGANTAVFSVVEAILSFPFPVERPDRVTLVHGENPARNLRREGVSADDFLDWRDQSRSFDYLVAVAPTAFNVVTDGEPLRVSAARVTEGFFEMMGSSISLGRAFRAEEATPGNDRVAVVTHGFWQRELGGRQDVLGLALPLDGVVYTVVGVAGPEFFFLPATTSLWAPLVLERGRAARDDRSLFAIARLRDGIRVEEADAELKTITERLAAAYPDTNAGWSSRVITVRNSINSSARFAMIVLYGSITAVLLIACANVANLLLSRATVREKEIALRAALGAERFRILRQLLTESIVLSLAGGAFGFVLALWGMGALRRMIAPDRSIGFLAQQMTMNVAVLGHVFLVSLLTGALFGLAPALQGSKPNLDETLKEGGRGGSGGRRHHFLRSGLVVAQIALALTLLAAAGALVWAFNSIYSADPGFNPKNLLTFQVSLPEASYGAPQQLVAFERQALERIVRVPGVQSAATTSALPLTLHPSLRTARVTVTGFSEKDQDQSLTLIHLSVSPSYFETLSVPILAGRGLTRQDDEDAQPVAVLSQAMARRYWPDADPIGRRFQLAGPGVESRWWSVVGVVGDVQTTAHSLRRPGALIPHVYLPQAQSPRRDLSIAVRASLDPLGLAPSIRAALAEVDRNLPLANLMTLEGVIARIDTQNRFFVRILSGLALIALLLAGVGIYAVISYSVHERTREIGIRMALGAQPRSILALVLRQVAVLGAVGFLIGIGAAVAVVRALASELEGVAAANAAGPLTFAVVSVVLLGVAQLACYLPARHAVRVDPVAALRNE